jgi:hypothetical protein
MVVSLGADVTVDALVSLIKQQAVVPNTASLFSSANVTSLLNDAMRKRLIPLVKSVKEEYWVTTTATQISASVNAYPIPYRAVAHALRDVALMDNNQNLLQLVRYEPEDIKFPLIPYNSPYFRLGYYLQDYNVILFPPQVSNYTSYQILMKWERRPSDLTLSTNCGYITSYSQGASTITLSVVPTSWQANVTTVDVINNLPPFNSIADDVVITNINGLVLTVSIPSTYSSTFWTNVANNFWLSRSMTSPIPQIPYEAFPYLAALGKKQLLSGLGDSGMMKECDDDIAEAKTLILSEITPRVEGTPKILSGFGGIINYGQNRIGNLG